jgi:hypothetical protein
MQACGGSRVKKKAERGVMSKVRRPRSLLGFQSWSSVACKAWIMIAFGVASGREGQAAIVGEVLTAGEFPVHILCLRLATLEQKPLLLVEHEGVGNIADKRILICCDMSAKKEAIRVLLRVNGVDIIDRIAGHGLRVLETVHTRSSLPIKTNVYTRLLDRLKPGIVYRVRMSNGGEARIVGEVKLQRRGVDAMGRKGKRENVHERRTDGTSRNVDHSAKKVPQERTITIPKFLEDAVIEEEIEPGVLCRVLAGYKQIPVIYDSIKQLSAFGEPITFEGEIELKEDAVVKLLEDHNFRVVEQYSTNGYHFIEVIVKRKMENGR